MGPKLFGESKENSVARAAGETLTDVRFAPLELFCRFFS
jgi:hypothetical protein